MSLQPPSPPPLPSTLSPPSPLLPLITLLHGLSPPPSPYSPILSSLSTLELSLLKPLLSQSDKVYRLRRYAESGIWVTSSSGYVTSSHRQYYCTPYTSMSNAEPPSTLYSMSFVRTLTVLLDKYAKAVSSFSVECVNVGGASRLVREGEIAWRKVSSRVGGRGGGGIVRHPRRQQTERSKGPQLHHLTISNSPPPPPPSPPHQPPLHFAVPERSLVRRYRRVLLLRFPPLLLLLNRLQGLLERALGPPYPGSPWKRGGRRDDQG